MRKLLLILMLLSATILCAEEKRSFWDRGLGRWLKKADQMVAGWQESGVDTNYIRRCEKDRFVYIGAYGYLQQHDMTFPVEVEKEELPQEILDTYANFMPSNFNDNKRISMDMHTTQAEFELGIDWRGIAIEIPIPVRNKYSKSYGLAKNGSVWGFRIRFKELSNMKGIINNSVVNMREEIDRRYEEHQNNPLLPETDTSPFYSEPRTIRKGDMTLHVFYTEGYYVFNHKRFSLAAGAYGDMKQLRPAGSMFAWLNYYQSRLKSYNTFNSEWDTFRNNKVSIGMGYGYNIPFAKGNGCVHMSVIPLFSVYNHLTHKNSGTSSPDDTKEWDIYNRHYYDAAKYAKDSGFCLNGLAKLAFSYTHNHMLYNLLFNYRQFFYNTSTDFKIANREADIQINIGYRF